MRRTLLRFEITRETDVVLARQRARRAAGLLGFDPQEQIRIATAVSEVARNAVQYAGSGHVQLEADDDSLVVRVEDAGPGMAHLADVLEGRVVPRSDGGIGLVSARRLVDRLDVESAPGRGTRVELVKELPRRVRPLTRAKSEAVASALAAASPPDPMAELRHQNRELIEALEEVRSRNAEIERLNQELEETNRGVLALYAELDEHAIELRRVSDQKSRFLSHLSHELRTPLNSILSLARILLDRLDGDLTGEQERQVTLILGSAQTLHDMVSDLLDLAKIESGKASIRPSRIDPRELLAGLRNVFRPMLRGGDIALVVEEPRGLSPLVTDEAKLSQILRNLLSNAIKYTEKGEIRLSARARDGQLVFSVADTGIGIAREDRERIFEEYEQVEHSVQQRSKGTGLGLPLSRSLARLLGGDLTVESAPGVGSRFELSLPFRPEGAAHEERRHA